MARQALVSKAPADDPPGLFPRDERMMDDETYTPKNAAPCAVAVVPLRW